MIYIEDVNGDVHTIDPRKCVWGGLKGTINDEYGMVYNVEFVAIDPSKDIPFINIDLNPDIYRGLLDTLEVYKLR